MTVLGVEPLFVALPPGHPAAECAEVGLSELRGYSWLLAVNGDDELDRHLAEQCHLAGAGQVVIRAADPLLLAQLMHRGDAVVAAVQALDTGIRLPGTVVELLGTPVRARQLLLWAEGGPVDDKLAEEVEVGLVAAYRSLVAERGRVPGWWDRHPGWLGSLRERVREQSGRDDGPCCPGTRRATRSRCRDLS